MVRSPTEMSPSKRGILRLKRADSLTQCASCPALTECPVCPEGHMCQLSIPASCMECPINTCVADPAYHKSSSKIGGALGGIVACFVVGALLYWFYQQRKRKLKESQKRLREATKIRLAEGEKFRPGDAKAGLDLASLRSRQASRDNNLNPFRDDRSKGRNGKSDEEIEVADEDTEWTVLREDGLTAYRRPPGSTEELIQPDSASDKRKSIGAATHLSRITEGFEEEDEDRNTRCVVNMKGNTIEEEEEPRSIASQRNRGQMSVISTRSEGDERSVDRSRMGDSFVDCNPFLDGSDTGSFQSHFSYDGQRASSILLGAFSSDGDVMHSVGIQPPCPAHRPLGAPLIDMQGKEKSGIRSYRNSQLESPLTSLVRKPSRPVRKPDLTLLLNDAVLNETDSVRQSVQSQESIIVSNQTELLYLAESDGKRKKAQELPADYTNSSHIYQEEMKGDLNEDKRCSTATASSAGSMTYVMSAPKIITPVDQGVQRLQLQQGKAQLIRVTGLQSNAEKDAKDRGKSCEARIRNPQSADLSMSGFSFQSEDEEGEEDVKSVLGMSSKSLSSPRSARHTNVPEDETEDEVEGSQAEVRTHRTGRSSDFDEVRLQYELAEYPFLRADGSQE